MRFTQSRNLPVLGDAADIGYRASQVIDQSLFHELLRTIPSVAELFSCRKRNTYLVAQSAEHYSVGNRPDGIFDKERIQWLHELTKAQSIRQVEPGVSVQDPIPTAPDTFF